MDPSHKKFIPSTYWKQIICSTDYVHCEQLIIVTCTKQGDLIEFHIPEDNIAKDSICIDLDDANVKEIKVFFALKSPVKFFYLLHTSLNELIVMEKLNSTLKIKEKIHKVEKYEISDKSNCGSPVVLIWYANSQEPNLVTDFTDQLSEHSPTDVLHDKLSNALKIQLNMLSDKINDRQVLLENKKIFMSDTLQSIVSSQQGYLRMKHVEQRIFSNKWFVLLELENITNIPIVVTNLVLTQKSELINYKSFLIEEGPSQVTNVKYVENKECLFIIMLDIPELKSEVVFFDGTLDYDLIEIKKDQRTKYGKVIPADNTVNSTQIKDSKNRLVIPSIELNITKFLENYPQFGIIENTSLQKLYCIMLASKEKFFTIIGSIESLHQTLTSKLGLSRLSVDRQELCFYYLCREELFQGMLLCIDKLKSTLCVYYKSIYQIQLVSVLCKQFIREYKLDKSKLLFSKFQSDVNYCLELLNNEIIHDTIIQDNPRDFFIVNKKQIFEIQKILSKYKTLEM